MKRVPLLLVSSSLLVPVAAAQWSTPVPLANVNSTAGDYGPAPTFDGLTLYFASSRTGGPGLYDLYRATRASRYGTFGAPMLIPELCSPSYDGDPCVRIDDREVFFYSDRPGGSGGYDLWRAERPSTSVPFQAPVPVAELNTSGSDLSPSLTLDGLRIYFYGTRPGGMGGYDIWTATRPDWTSPFGVPAPVTELNTATDDRDPHIAPDGLVMFFASNRTPGQGNNDIWMASRLDVASPFGNIVNLSALNSTVVDHAPGFAHFTDEVFFTSTRPGGLGAYDIHSARFTGLVGVGIAGARSRVDLRFSDPSSPGLVYLAASSRGNSPGIPIDSRVLPLNFDLLFRLAIGGIPPILTGYVGILDQDGIASGGINFAGFPEFAGLRFFTAFVVIDPTAPSGIRTISNAHEVVVQ